EGHAHSRPAHPPQRHAHRDHFAGHRFFRARPRRGSAVLHRRRSRPVDDQLRHDDQRRAPGAVASARRVVDDCRVFRFHVRDGAVGGPVRRRGARRVRAEGAHRGAGQRMSEILLRARDLRTVLDGAGGQVRAVDGVDFEIRRGETFAIVGESGCGKTMTALSLMRLLPETGRIVSGSVELAGADVLALPEAAMRAGRGRRVAMIFQEPATSLNPVLTIGTQIREVLERHTDLRGAQIDKRVRSLLESVGVPDAERRAEEYPFQLSGGLKQRAMIAMALAAGPDLLIADEPTTALDVTIQAQVLELLRDLQKKNGMAILLITHDLGIVAPVAPRGAGMYAGQMVEIAEAGAFFKAPQHPYSRKLFEALPGSGKRGADLAVIKGQVPPLTQEFRRCRFTER